MKGEGGEKRGKKRRKENTISSLALLGKKERVEHLFNRPTMGKRHHQKKNMEEKEEKKKEETADFNFNFYPKGGKGMRTYLFFRPAENRLKKKRRTREGEGRGGKTSRVYPAFEYQKGEKKRESNS